MPEQPDRRLSKSWEVAMRGTDGEWDTTELHSYDHTPEVDPELFTRQAPPHKINMTKRQRPSGEVEQILFFGDTHFPFQERKKIALANLAVRVLMPDVVTYVGDDLDMALFSRFETRSEWADSTQAGIDQFSDQLAQTRADIGSEGQIIVHEGNHNVRFARELRKYNAELLGIKRANAEQELGVLSLANLLRCDELDVEYIGGYPTSEYWHNDNLMSHHGNTVQSGGLAVAKDLRDATTNRVRGHDHRAGIVYKTFRDGRDEKTIFGMGVGTFADPEQTPSGQYATSEQGNVLRQAQNWQSVLGRVSVIDDEIIPEIIPITNQGVLINGKWYKS